MGQPITDVFLDILAESEFEATMKAGNLGGGDAESTAEILQHPKIVPGISDGGAHMKTACNGQWSTDLIIRFARDASRFTLEQLHYYMSGKTAEMFEIDGRGLLREGYAADIMIYDFEKLSFDKRSFKMRSDLPGDDWRLTCPVEGIRYILVNGVVTFVDGICTNATPGHLISNRRGNRATLAA
jgi:N-acyl-D-aspartate/D-glutamate deacylase